MNASPALHLAVVAIGWLTLVSGAVQMMAPDRILGILNSDVSPASSHFFGIVGMFMILFGGLLVHSTRLQSAGRAPMLWCAAQKLGAAGAVALGVYHQVFSTLALAVAGFDFFSACLILAYRSRAHS